ncbi:MAG: hypothetical protein K0R54_4268 [Clostridiaceae bacterium]|jgi:glycosyltransferase involved in cell wall biosynthesis|nr:hypothetical protein [Clostridiaceae bacterium]
MNILHLLISGGVGGIEILNKDIFLYSQHNNIYCFVHSGGQIADELARDLAKISILNNIKKYSIFKLIIMLQKICYSERIDKIVVHHASPILWGACCLIKKKQGIQFYIYTHGNIDEGLNDNNKILLNLRKFILKTTYLQANRIIAISQSVADSIISFYPKIKNKVTLLYNGIDTDKYNLELIQTQNTILYIGRLSKEKGVDLLLKSIAILKCNTECIIIGDGPEREKLEQLSIDLGLSNIVRFFGIQRNIQEWHKKATVFVHPATCEEGFGITLIEAMASGVPCIAFKKGAIPEIIDNNINGFIVDNVFYQDLANEIEKVFYIVKKHPQKWETIRENARSKAMQFNINKMVRELDIILKT